MAKIWVLGPIAWDWVFQVESSNNHQQSDVEFLGGRPGGYAANVARGLSSAGHQVWMVGNVGTDKVGRLLIDDLQNWGVNIRNVRQSRGLSHQVQVTIGPLGQRVIRDIVPDTTIDISPHHKELMLADCVYVGSRYSGMEYQTPQLKRSDVMVVSAPPVEIQKWPTNIVVGSEEEFRDLWKSNFLQNAKAIVDDGVEWLIMTKGKDGATASSGSRTIEVAVPATNQKVVDTTGAGDAFTAGLIHAILNGLTIEGALHLGQFWASKAIVKRQSVPPRWNELFEDWAEFVEICESLG